MSIKEFAEKFIEVENEAWYQGNIDALEALEHPNVVYNMTPPFQFVGWEAHKQQILGLRQALSNYKHEWKYLTGDGSIRNIYRLGT